MTDEAKKAAEILPPVEQAERPNLERAFRDFLESGQRTIPNIVMVPTQQQELHRSSGIGSELRTAAYAIGLAALLAGAIFGGITLGTQYSNGYVDSSVQEKINKETEDLKDELERLQNRIEQLERAAKPTNKP